MSFAVKGSMLNGPLHVGECLLQVKPLIWIESVIEKHSHSRIEYMIKVGCVYFQRTISLFADGTHCTVII